MNAKTVREDVIRPKLVQVFGNSLANSLIAKSIVAGMEGSTESEKLKLIVESICSDPKVVNVWGAEQIAKHKQEWMTSLK